MEQNTFWTILSVVLLISIAVLSIFYFIRSRQEKREQRDKNVASTQNNATSYQLYFILGITWIPIGIHFKNYLILTIGIVLTLFGFLNKDKWKNVTPWKDLNPKQKTLKLLIIFSLLFTLAFGSYLFFSKLT